MTRDPVLAVKTLPPGDGYRVARTFKVEGGLHFLRGNAKPYFSLTYTAHRKGFPEQCYSGGAGHDEILRHFPRFADLAALHLSDIDGVPMHVEANGWYKLAGALGGMGEQYHAGNTEGTFPITPPADKPWKDTEYRKPTRDECLKMFADHCRIGMDEARNVAGWIEGTTTTYSLDDARRKFAGWIAEQRPRWKAEAAACILKHGLKVYGDQWTAEIVEARS